TLEFPLILMSDVDKIDDSAILNQVGDAVPRVSSALIEAHNDIDRIVVSIADASAPERDLTAEHPPPRRVISATNLRAALTVCRRVTGELNKLHLGIGFTVALQRRVDSGRTAAGSIADHVAYTIRISQRFIRDCAELLIQFAIGRLQAL